MTGARRIATFMAAAALLLVGDVAWAQTRVEYGRITAARQGVQVNRTASNVGAIAGGALGAASAGSRSRGNAAMRGGAGALAGQRLGRMATDRPAFEYTVLLGGTSTITIVTDESGMRVGDCVAVERGSFNNLRLVDDARCATQGARGAAADVAQADACNQAKEQLLAAETDEAFDRAERRVRLLCVD